MGNKLPNNNNNILKDGTVKDEVAACSAMSLVCTRVHREEILRHIHVVSDKLSGLTEFKKTDMSY